MARPPDGQLDELRVQRDRGIEHFRNRAVLLGIPRDADKAGIVEAWHLASQGERRPADLESMAVRIERDRGFRGKLRRVEARRLQAERQRQAKASGVRSANQIFGICALLALEAV